MNSALLSKIIDLNVPVLITGPTGSGKSRLARQIYDQSLVFREQFLTVHLASLKEDLLESELFGHKKGAFTGAVENKSGYFKDVGHGTLFLDEIGELSLEAQKKLLYVLEERKFTPIGATVALEFKGRLIMATNKNLLAMMKSGSFREDLYFRLCMFHLELQPIAGNKKLLKKEIFRLLAICKLKYEKQQLELSSEVLEMMLQFSWKGNYRELKNCIEYMTVISDGPEILREHIPLWLSTEVEPENRSSSAEFIEQFSDDMDSALEKFEEWYLSAKLNKYSGRVNETAKVLGISKTTLINKARRYGINTLQIKALAAGKKGPQKAA